MYPIINIFGRQIGSYALLSIIGLILCTVLLTVLSKKYGLFFEDVILIVLVIVLGVIVGGHILYFLTNANKFITFLMAGGYTFKEFLYMIAHCGGGMVFYGGFIGALISVSIYSHSVHKQQEKQIMDLFAVGIPLFHFFGRLGCFFGGCCYGIESKFGFIVQNNILYPELNGVRRLPVALIEAAINLLIFVLLLTLLRKKYDGLNLIYVYMLAYSAVRFVLEFFRGDEIRGRFWIFTTSQWISVCLFGIAVIYFLRKFYISKKQGAV